MLFIIQYYNKNQNDMKNDLLIALSTAYLLIKKNSKTLNST